MSAFLCRILYLFVFWVSDSSALVLDGDIDTFYTILHWNRTWPQVRRPVACAWCLLPLWGLTSLTVYWSFSLRDTLMQRPCKSSVSGVWWLTNLYRASGTIIGISLPVSLCRLLALEPNLLSVIVNGCLCLMSAASLRSYFTGSVLVFNLRGTLCSGHGRDLVPVWGFLWPIIVCTSYWFFVSLWGPGKLAWWLWPSCTGIGDFLFSQSLKCVAVYRSLIEDLPEPSCASLPGPLFRSTGGWPVRSFRPVTGDQWLVGSVISAKICTEPPATMVLLGPGLGVSVFVQQNLHRASGHNGTCITSTGLPEPLCRSTGCLSTGASL